MSEGRRRPLVRADYAFSRRPTTSAASRVPQEASGHFASNRHPKRSDKKAMSKATISRRVLDSLIRAKLAKTNGCGNVEPLPVEWKDPNANGCNWEIPGWTGDARHVATCTEQLRDYLRFLRDQFDILEEEAPNGR